jgi:hypothetical protein
MKIMPPLPSRAIDIPLRDSTALLGPTTTCGDINAGIETWASATGAARSPARIAIAAIAAVSGAGRGADSEGQAHASA